MFGTCFQICSALFAVAGARLGGVLTGASRVAARALDALLEAIAAAIWPGACIVCGGAHPAGSTSGLCAACCALVEDAATGPRCLRCDALLAWGATPREVCGACRGRPLGVTRVIALGPHEGPLRIALRRFKFYGRAASARPLGRMLAWRLEGEGLDAGALDVVVSVPATPGRERERGFDQARALAVEVASALGLPYAGGALERPARDVAVAAGAGGRDGPAVGAEQKSLDRRDRWRAAREAFRASPGAPEVLAGKRVLLVDDVCTSGATLAACAAACRGVGAVSVTAGCLTRQAREHLMG